MVTACTSGAASMEPPTNVSGCKVLADVRRRSGFNGAAHERERMPWCRRSAFPRGPLQWSRPRT